MAKTKVLVTGAAGYIGSVLVRNLLEKGYEVIALDNFMYQQTSLLDVCHFKTLRIIRGDARDEALLAHSMAGAEYVIPLACLVGAPLCDRDPVGARTTNLDAITAIIKHRKAGQKIIFPNTNSGYGRGQKNTAYCDETSSLNPISLYGKLKVVAEKELLTAGDVVVFRLATVFGISPRMRLDLLVNDFVYRAITDRFVILFEPQFKRNYIHVRDVSKAFIHALEHFKKMRDEIYNVGLDDTNLNKWELCREIQKQVPAFIFLEAPIGEDPDKRDYVVSNAKIKKTGFKPDFSLKEGIRELVKGFQVVRRGNFSNIT